MYLTNQWYVEAAADAIHRGSKSTVFLEILTSRLHANMSYSSARMLAEDKVERRLKEMPYPKDYSGNCIAGCGHPATRWIDIERFGDKRFVSWPYCKDHGNLLLDDEGVTTRPLKRA